MIDVEKLWTNRDLRNFSQSQQVQCSVWPLDFSSTDSNDGWKMFFTNCPNIDKTKMTCNTGENAIWPETNKKYVDQCALSTRNMFASMLSPEFVSPLIPPKQNNQNAQIMSREEALVTLTEKTSYPILQENGQRRYGPPPDWVGPQPPRGCEVFIGKIPRDCFEDELVPVFEMVGRIYMFRLMMDFSGCNRGYGFCIYTNREDTRRAVAELDSYEIRRGKMLGVCFSVDNCRLFVGGIPKTKTKDEIMAEMLKVTEGVKDVIVYPSIADKTKNRGFAFVEYENHKAAAMARRKLIPGRIHLWGHQIAVDWAEPEREVDEDIMSKVRILYVRNLMLHTTEETLRDYFNHAIGALDAVERVKKIRDYAFVHFRDRMQASAALRRLDGTILDGSQIEVTWAKPVDKNEPARACRNNVVNMSPGPPILSNCLLPQYRPSSHVAFANISNQLKMNVLGLPVADGPFQIPIAGIIGPAPNSLPITGTPNCNIVPQFPNARLNKSILSYQPTAETKSTAPSGLVKYDSGQLELSAFELYNPTVRTLGFDTTNNKLIQKTSQIQCCTTDQLANTNHKAYNDTMNSSELGVQSSNQSGSGFLTNHNVQPLMQYSNGDYTKNGYRTEDMPSFELNEEITSLMNQLTALCSNLGLGQPKLTVRRCETFNTAEGQRVYVAQLYVPGLQRQFHTSLPTKTVDESVKIVVHGTIRLVLSHFASISAQFQLAQQRDSVSMRLAEQNNTSSPQYPAARSNRASNNVINPVFCKSMEKSNVHHNVDKQSNTMEQYSEIHEKEMTAPIRFKLEDFKARDTTGNSIFHKKPQELHACSHTNEMYLNPVQVFTMLKPPNCDLTNHCANPGLCEAHAQNGLSNPANRLYHTDAQSNLTPVTNCGGEFVISDTFSKKLPSTESDVSSCHHAQQSNQHELFPTYFALPNSTVVDRTNGQSQLNVDQNAALKMNQTKYLRQTNCLLPNAAERSFEVRGSIESDTINWSDHTSSGHVVS